MAVATESLRPREGSSPQVVLDLIDRLTYQIQHGCSDPECPQPYCLTFRKLHSQVTIRCHSALSARSMALAIASRENSQIYLCPKLERIMMVPAGVSRQERIDSGSLLQQLSNTQTIRELRISAKRKHAYDAARNVISNFADIYRALDTDPPFCSDDNLGTYYQDISTALVAMCTLLPKMNQDAWRTFADANKDTFSEPGRAVPQDVLTALDIARSEVTSRLLIRLLADEILIERLQSTLDVLLAHTQQLQRASGSHGDAGPYHQRPAAVWLLWTQIAFVDHWDGEHRVQIDSCAGRALEWMRILWANRHTYQLDLAAEHFVISRMSNCADDKNALSEWLDDSSLGNVQTRSIFDHAFLFSEEKQRRNFRESCFGDMKEAYKAAQSATASRVQVRSQLSVADEIYLDHRMKVAQQHYLVLRVRRERILSDAYDQLWQREKRELLRPLRVRMGLDEGEIGHDLGGVQIEFYNLICQEVLNPEMDLFVTDSETQLSWFCPFSLQPLYKYELFGLLFGLAMYNNITIPISFPLILYKMVLEGTEAANHVAWDDFEEGWPALAHGLRSLLQYDGDVEHDLARDFAFTAEANGLRLDVDMRFDGQSDRIPPHMDPTYVTWCMRTFSVQTAEGPQPRTLEPEEVFDLRWPGWSIESPSDQRVPPPVTLANRKDFVQKYMEWTTYHSVQPQVDAFLKGCRYAVNPKLNTLLLAETCRKLVEGQEHLDISELQNVTNYDGYTKDSDPIKWFWEIVRSYPHEKQKSLVEFVTASKRVPASGISGLPFHIHRTEGDTQALPGSQTCFHILRMPEYENIDVLRRKLDIALEHSIGFGQA